MNDASLFRLLIEHARNDAHTEFALIPNIFASFTARTFRKAVKTYAKRFKKLKGIASDEYVSELKKGNSPADLLQLVAVYHECAVYYEQEAKILKEMLKEFRLYVMSGHLLKTLLGASRSKRDMVDYRSLPVRPF